MSNGWARKANTPAEQARRKQYASAQHRAAVKEVKRLVALGVAHCWRCGRHLPPGSKAHAGHDDHDRTIYRGPECPPCNLRTAARKGNLISNTTRAVTRHLGTPRFERPHW